MKIDTSSPAPTGNAHFFNNFLVYSCFRHLFLANLSQPFYFYERPMFKRALLAAAIAAFSVGSATADFTVTVPGPVASAGPVGDVGNGTFVGTYSGPTGIWGQLSFSGTLTSVISGTYTSEARWSITTPNGSFTYQPATGTSAFTTANITNSVNTFLFASPGNYSFQAFESFNDGAGPDSNWTNPSFTFVDSAAAVMTLAELPFGATQSFNTLGSSYDTELGLFSSNGTLITSDDDGAGGTASLINSGLAPGTYYLLAGGFNSTFFNGGAGAGAAGGSLLLNINGQNVFSGSGVGGQFNIFQFNVASTPAPPAVWMGLVGAAALVRLRRRLA